MGKEFKDKVFKGLIWSFLVLYAIVGFVSFYHCIEFCSVGNPLFLSVLMSFAFEVGLALTLFSILITDENKNNLVSWILMTLLTCVQVMGNIFSVEKYMELSQNNFYVYIQNGFLHWFTEDMPQRDVMSIIAILLGALLPFVALLMTSMVARNWKNKVHEDELLKAEAEKNVNVEPLPVEPVTDSAPEPDDAFDGQIEDEELIPYLKDDDEKTEPLQPEVIEEVADVSVIEDSSLEDVSSGMVFSAPEVPETKPLENLVNKAKELASEEEQKNEIIDVRPETRSGNARMPFSFFKPLNS